MPSITASRTTASILSPFSTACASVSAIGSSALRGAARYEPHRDARLVDRRDDRRELVAVAVEHRQGIPGLQPQHAAEMLRLLVGQIDLAAQARARRARRTARSRSRLCASGGSEPGPRAALPAHLPTAYLPAARYTRAHVFFRGQTIGKYRIVSALGSGGFGSVYLAEDTWIDKKVALKVPHKQGLDFSELLKEPRLLASMSHPNIVTVLTAEKQDDIFFIVMEYVAGRDARGEDPSRRRPRRGARARPHLPDLQRGRSRAPRRHPAPRSPAGQHAGVRDRAAQGHRLRHLALPRNRGPRHDHHRQPALHGARAVPRQGRLRQRRLLDRRDDVSDAHRHAPLCDAVAGRSRSADEGRARVVAAAAQPQDSRRASPTS